MKITDSPYAAGTPEHGEWVRSTYIPAVSARRTREDRAKYGAESIGATLMRPLPSFAAQTIAAMLAVPSALIHCDIDLQPWQAWALRDAWVAGIVRNPQRFIDLTNS